MEKEENLNQNNTEAETSNENDEADKQSGDKQKENKSVEELKYILKKRKLWISLLIYWLQDLT